MNKGKGKEAHVSDVTLRALRHTFPSDLIMAGVDLAAASKLL